MLSAGSDPPLCLLFISELGPCFKRNQEATSPPISSTLLLEAGTKVGMLAHTLERGGKSPGLGVKGPGFESQLDRWLCNLGSLWKARSSILLRESFSLPVRTL